MNRTERKKLAECRRARSHPPASPTINPMNYDPWDWRKPSESPAESIGTGLLMLALICASIVCLAALHP